MKRNFDKPKKNTDLMRRSKAAMSQRFISGEKTGKNSNPAKKTPNTASLTEVAKDAHKKQNFKKDE